VNQVSDTLQVQLLQLRIFCQSDQTVSAIRAASGPAELSVGAEIALQDWLATSAAQPDQEQQVVHTAANLAQALASELILTLRVDGANRWLHFDPAGQLRQQYDKIHLFSPLKEAASYRRGHTVATSLTKNGWCIGAATCYDLRFPELFRILRARGAELFVLPARWPRERLPHWRILCQARALENQCWLVGVNACGSDPVKPELVYGGGSLVVSPQGEVVAEAGSEAEVLVYTLERDQLTDFRASLPVWEDRQLW